MQQPLILLSCYKDTVIEALVPETVFLRLSCLVLTSNWYLNLSNCYGIIPAYHFELVTIHAACKSNLVWFVEIFIT